MEPRTVVPAASWGCTVLGFPWPKLSHPFPPLLSFIWPHVKMLLQAWMEFAPAKAGAEC